MKELKNHLFASICSDVGEFAQCDLVYYRFVSRKLFQKLQNKNKKKKDIASKTLIKVKHLKTPCKIANKLILMNTRLINILEKNTV